MPTYGSTVHSGPKIITPHYKKLYIFLCPDSRYHHMYRYLFFGAPFFIYLSPDALTLLLHFQFPFRPPSMPFKIFPPVPLLSSPFPGDIGRNSFPGVVFDILFSELHKLDETLAQFRVFILLSSPGY
jgi:hypothetical protein